ncbi:type II secretion system protein GspC [Pseudohalioglobus lutimaris]|uniref:type II secretion system protein GspC n=1 Tax=Pseudohalioglobus lutimaris TaxID=1737061 RepID=UPI0012F7F06E|nr:type II secretion system protein GspC [Pseudohalioglobus lutimaris]
MRSLAQPDRARRLRLALALLLVLWMVWSVVGLFWALFPAAEVSEPEGARVVNPVIQASTGANRVPVDIEELRGRHLFGEAISNDAVAAAVPEPEAAVDESRDGIENNARETRLQLVLRGVVASSENGLGHAIIEHRKKQAVYAVEDELPVGNNVVLAKVMPRQVVLDNNGTYELLVLFEESDVGAAVEATARTPVRTNTRAPANRGAPELVDKRDEDSATELAREYRNRLYENPQSLADVVAISAVREDGRLLGYRIAPGKDREQFSQLGFKAGDLVTSVNGIVLDDPANTMRLYQTMRSASEAVFDLQRADQQISISVSLGTGSE